MENSDKSENIKKEFYLNKWFLDFVSESGETLIFYAAELTWKKFKVPYTSWLHYNKSSGIKQGARFRNLNFPEINETSINWKDKKFEISGKWEALSVPLNAKLFDSDEGFLDWNCLQPIANVEIEFKGKIYKGYGYVENLKLTVAPWKIPMQELRWGRFLSTEFQIVWIEIKDVSKQQWLWINGERIDNVVIDDNYLAISSKNIRLEMDRAVVLESGKKIMEVVKDIINFIPGFNKAMPIKFLTADENKWLSHGKLFQNNELVADGWAIHEYVNFNPKEK